MSRIARAEKRVPLVTSPLASVDEEVRDVPGWRSHGNGVAPEAFRQADEEGARRLIRQPPLGFRAGNGAVKPRGHAPRARLESRSRWELFSPVPVLRVLHVRRLDGPPRPFRALLGRLALDRRALGHPERRDRPLEHLLVAETFRRMAVISLGKRRQSRADGGGGGRGRAGRVRERRRGPRHLDAVTVARAVVKQGQSTQIGRVRRAFARALLNLLFRWDRSRHSRQPPVLQTRLPGYRSDR